MISSKSGSTVLGERKKEASAQNDESGFLLSVSSLLFRIHFTMSFLLIAIASPRNTILNPTVY
ncbi:MAG: hypothetical protein ACI4K7_00205, partial [Oscillospiraceae bacterium]